MTGPTSGGSYEYTNDSVAAHLSVDLPPDAINSLTQLATLTAQVRTNIEATVRAQGDYAEYLRQLPQIAQQSADASDRFFSSAAGNLMGGLGPEATRGAGPMGRNDARATDFSSGPGTGAGRMEEQLQQLRDTDPRQYANVIAQHSSDRIIYSPGDDLPEPRGGGGGGGGGNRPGGAPPPSGRPPRNPRTQPVQQDENWLSRLEDYQRRGDSALSNILRETQAGGSSNGFGLASSGVRGARAIATGANATLSSRISAAEEAARQEALAGGASAAEAESAAANAAGGLRGIQGLAGTAARGAGIVGAGLAVATTTQNVGEFVQKYRNQGAVRGGGFAEGVGFEMNVRTMAMNPFISMEQSRKIMQSALSEGYTGKEFDTVTAFMADNLKKMNVDVAESVKVLNNQVNRGGQSIAGAQSDLEAISSTARDKNVTVTSAQARSQYENVVNNAIDNGVGGAEASQYAQIISRFGNTSRNPDLKNISQQFSASTSNPLMSQVIAPDYKGSPVGALDYALEQDPTGQTVAKRQQDFVTQAAQQFMEMYKRPDGQSKAFAIQGLQMRLKAAGMDFSYSQAKAILDGVSDGSFQKEFDKSVRQKKEANTGGTPKKKSFWGNVSKGLEGAGEFLAGAAVSTINPDLGDDWMNEAGRKIAIADGYSNPRIESLMMRYGSDAKIKGADGKERSLDHAALQDKNLMNDLVSGKAQVKVPGGQYSTLENLSAQQDAADTSGGRGGSFDLTPRAAQLLQLLPDNNGGTNQTQRSSNSAEDNAQRNKPQAGGIYDGGGGG